MAMPLIKLLYNVVRGYRSKAGNTRLNSGISKRLQIIKEDHPDIENVDVNEESLDNLETGITPVNKRLVKNDRIAELKKIERKFFKKEPNPNLLTWGEKEQIRYLYNLDPTTWTPDKLSECFPATSSIIKKLIKSQWKPFSTKRILHHDNNVKENWRALENGHLKLPDSLNAHIKSFVSRKKILNLPMPEKSIQTCNFSPASSEFLNIVKNEKESPPSDNSTTNEHSIDKNLHPTHRKETYILKQKESVPLKHKYYTLRQLKKEISNNTSKTGVIELNINDNDNFKEIQPKVDSELLQKSSNALTPSICKKNVTETTEIHENIDKIPLKIKIPKDKLVKCKTHVYKVNDCYYDYEGNFIYKVPGMV